MPRHPAAGRPRRRCLLFAGWLALAGCSLSGWQATTAETEARGAMAGVAAGEGLADRRQRVVMPRPRQPEPEPERDQRTDEAPAPALRLSLGDALRLAVAGNREYLTQREEILQEGLRLTDTRFRFGPQLSGTVAAVWSDVEDQTAQNAYSGGIGASQILPTGATVSLDGDARLTQQGGRPDQWFTSGVLRLRQPLLRGFGYEPSHEALTQAERGAVYTLREFELFRQRFTIDVARAFFDLVRQQQTLANQQRTLEEARFDRRKAEAFFAVDRNDERQVFLARRREVLTENDYIDARANYARAVDAFKVRLGLPTDQPLEIVPQDPEFEPVDYDDDSAVRAALHNRLELQTLEDRLEDADRQIRLAENDLLPDLGLDAAWGVDGFDDDIGGAAPDRWSSSIGLSMELPLQRKVQRTALRSVQIARERSLRSLQLQRDQVSTDVTDALRELRSIEQRIVLQREQIEQERSAVAIMEIRYEAGNVDNRELLEARQALFDARNELIRLQVDHFIGRLELLRLLGVLFLDDEGMWQ